MKIFVDRIRDRRPGEFLFVICSPKSYHRTAVAIEDAGYEIRDCIMYLYSMHDRVMYIPICVARKPLDGTVVNNVLKHGCGGLNIDGSRVVFDKQENDKRGNFRAPTDPTGWKCSSKQVGSITDDWQKGRWPANIIHDGSDTVLAAFPQTKGGNGKLSIKKNTGVVKMGGTNPRQSHSDVFYTDVIRTFTDSGSAARYFYCAQTLHDVVTYLRKMI